ncbi:MAG: putative membrane protein YdjX (TVP38/TMEM64 family) [Ilumatobacter sp.]|jgi:uncharacterized membrane protein YdjX (TVP38/TMEM64 family)
MNRRIIALAALATVIIVFFASGGYTWVTGDGNVERLLTETGVIGPLVFVLIMWCTQPFGVPGFIYMAPAGIVWPHPLAIALAWTGNMGASYIAFSFARWSARDWVSVRIPTRMRRYDDRLESGGVWPVVLLRLLFGQLPPADWLLGVTKVSTRNFLIGTGIGIIPGVVFVVVAGGGLIDFLGDMSTSTRRILVAVLVALAIGRRLWKLRCRRQAKSQGLLRHDFEKSSDLL